MHARPRIIHTAEGNPRGREPEYLRSQFSRPRAGELVGAPRPTLARLRARYVTAAVPRTAYYIWTGEKGASESRDK